MTQPVRVRLVLFTLFLGVFSYFYQAGGWNQNVRFDLVRAVVEDQTLVIDRFARNTGDLSRRGDHFYCDKAPGVSFLGVPAYAAVHAAHGPPTTPASLTSATWITTIVAIAIPSAIAVAFFAGLGTALTIKSGPAAALAVAWAIGTLAWPYSTVFYGHQLVAALLVIAFGLLVPVRRRKVEPTGLRLFTVGFLLAAAVVVEYPAALASLVIGLYALSFIPPRRVPVLIAGAIVPGLALAAYHTAAFGGPLVLPYEFSTQPHRHMGWFMGLGLPDLTALWSILFSDYRGLFYASPWLLLALPGAVRLAFRGFGREVAVCVAIVVLFIWLNTSLVDWQGGWAMGPRYLVPAIPFLAVLAGGVILPSAQPAAPVTRRLAWLAAALFVGYSVFLMLVGTAVKPEVPSHIERPYQQYLLPRFYRGEVAVSTQSFDMSGHPDRGVAHARNAGQLAGLAGGASLVPLAVWLAAGLALLVVVARTPAAAPPVSAASPAGARAK
jgi:hypothetical protein